MSAAPVVHLIDDDESFLTATARLLRASGFAVKMFGSGQAFFDEVGHDAAGCAIIDFRMPGMSGLDVQAALADRHPGLPVIFLTGEGDIPTSVKAMRGGAEDFLEKRVPKKELLDAVSRALERDATRRMERGQRDELRARFDLLSEREHEVLQHVVRGKLNKQIAADLDICERTVKLHRTAITTKLGVPSVAEITRLAHEAGILEEPTFPKGQ